MGHKKQIFRGILTSLCILFCYTVGLTLYFTFPEQFIWYTVFSIICVCICLFIMFSNNHLINHWIWLGIFIGLPLGYYFYELLYAIFPNLYVVLHPYLYTGTINRSASSLIIFVAQYFGAFLFLLPLAYDILKTSRRDAFFYHKFKYIEK